MKKKLNTFQVLDEDISDESVSAFQAELYACGPTGMGWLLSPEPPEESRNIPEVENILFSQEFIAASDKVHLKVSLSLTLEKIVEIEKLTRGQVNNPLWLLARKHRLTASNFGHILKACRRNRYPPSFFQTLSVGIYFDINFCIG